MKKSDILPSALTSANMLFGFLAIVNAIAGEFMVAGWLIVIAGIMDAFDGKLARKISKGSRFGKEFDSLADLSSFGVAPAVLVYTVCFERFQYLGVIFSFLLILCGAFRLARFNTSRIKNNNSTYTGLPIPAAALTISSFINFNFHLWGELKLHLFLPPLIIALCFLMVSYVGYYGVPRLSFRESRNNRWRLIILIGGLIIIAVSPATFFFPLCAVYILEGSVRSIVQSIRKAQLKMEVESYEEMA